MGVGQVIPAGATNNCISCLRKLMEAEKKFYEYRCEECERKEWMRVKTWREGRPDAELDGLFATPRPA